MKTKILKLTDENREEAAALCRDVFLQGGLVAFPTETVYGLGGNALDPTAAERIYAAKGRPSDNPLIVHVGNFSAARPLVKRIPRKATKLMKAFWPGPLTVIFEKAAVVPEKTTGGLKTVAIRMPSHPFANLMLRRSPVPVAAPSANRSGRPSTTSAAHVIEDLDGRVDLIIDDGSSPIGVESTIIDLSGKEPTLLRPGHISKEELEAVIGPVKVDPAIETAAILSGKACEERPKAPGMKYRHYAPKAPLTVVGGTEEAVIRFLQSQGDQKTGILTVEEHRALFPEAGTVVTAGSRSDSVTMEHELFAALRSFDETDVKTIYAEDLSLYGASAAVMNRLYKAAGGNRITV